MSQDILPAARILPLSVLQCVDQVCDRFEKAWPAPGSPGGRPRIFVSHGVHDRILPIDMCGRQIVAGLRGAEYDVDFREFDGGHEMPEPIIRAAFDWLVS